MASREYTPIITELIAEKRLNSLGPGIPNKAVYSQLKRLTIDKVFEGHAVGDRDMAECCLSGLWLYHNYLDESHKISQEIYTNTGSYWHGIMHRREPDYGNSAYWFRRVGDHPIFESLCRAAAELAKNTKTDQDTDFLISQSKWDPYAFIDLCQSAYNKNNECERLCQEIQLQEWQLLFDYCYQMANNEG